MPSVLLTGEALQGALAQQLAQFLANGISAGSVYAIVGVGFGISYSVCKYFQFTQAALIALGAYMAWSCFHLAGLPMIVALVVAIGFTGCVGAGLQYFFYNTLVSRHSSRLVILLASLGAYIVLQNLISLLFGDEFLTLAKRDASVPLIVSSARITSVQLLIFVTNLLVCCGGILLLKFTAYGRFCRAAADNGELAREYGVPVTQVHLGVSFVTSCVFAVAGILIGFDRGMGPTMGFDPLLMGVAAGIVGGIGNVLGTVSAALLMGLVEVFGVWRLPTQWQHGLVFAIVAVVVFLRPNGLFVKSSSIREL
jgi:branched-chain amino acid transport system permease protein